MRNARPLPLVARIGTAFGLALLTYLAAAFTLASLPANAGWRPPTKGVTIWVEQGPIHTDLVLPKLAAGVDWRPLAPARDLADPRYAGYGYLAIGWGERGFFLGTPTWRELRPGPILTALAGSDQTLVHVEHVPRPVPSDDVRAITLRPAEYRRLAAFLRASVRPGGPRFPGYGPADAFYEGRGRYDAFTTCNSWTGAALRHAGVRVGRWTPLPAMVLGWF